MWWWLCWLQSGQQHMMAKFQAHPVSTVEAVVPAMAISSTGRRPYLSEAQPARRSFMDMPEGSDYALSLSLCVYIVLCILTCIYIYNLYYMDAYHNMCNYIVYSVCMYSVYRKCSIYTCNIIYYNYYSIIYIYIIHELCICNVCMQCVYITYII